MRSLIFLSLAGALSCAFAQPMSDPMRPPGASAGSDDVAAVASGAGLQAVVISPSRKLAVIDGEVVPLGAAVREGTLSGLSDSSAVLKKKGSERDVLLMHPNIDKRPSKRGEEP
jgi:MSHA biogenesis protein MshK